MLIPKELVAQAKDKYGEKAAILIAEELKLESFDDKNLKARCFSHSEETPSLIWNPKNNNYHCFGCGINYSIIDHFMSYNKLTYLESVEKLFRLVEIDYRFGEKGVRTNHGYKYPDRECFEDRSIVEKYMASRGISVQTLDYADVQSDINGNVVFHYYDLNDVLRMVKYRHARKVTKKEDKYWAQVHKDTLPLLYGMNKIDNTQPLVITEGECLPGDTEIFTDKGWIKLEQYNNEQVLAVDSSMNGKFVVPDAFIRKHYAGKMLHYQRKNFFANTTENHNMVFFNSKNELCKLPAKEIPILAHGHIPISITINGAGIPLSDDQIALYLAISADCTIDVRNTGSRYSRFSAKKERKVVRLKNILDNLNIKYFENNVPNKLGMKYIGFITPDWVTNKLLPMEWCVIATKEQREFILQEMVYWDGNRVPNRNQTEYSSKHYENALFMQTIAHTCNKSSTIMLRKNLLGQWYKVSILHSKNSVSLQKKFDNYYDYDGMVYCVTVNTGMILVRQRNHISVTGNCDALAVIESGHRNVVSVPFGANTFTWLEHNWDFLEQFSKIIVFSDNDKEGIKMRKEACARLGTWRSFYVEYPDEILFENGEAITIKDANDVLLYYGKQKVIDLINHANEVPIENIVDLYDVGDFDIETAQGLYSGFSELDKYINKFVLGTVLVFTGRTGSGKSSLLNQMFIAEPLNQGLDVFVHSGEMGKPILKNWLELVLAGREHVKLINNTVHKIDKDIVQIMRNWYKGRIFVYDNDKDLSADSILDRLEAVVRRQGVKVAVLDNLMTIDLGTSNQDNLWLEQKKFVVRLINFANKYGILIVLVSHPRKTAEFRRLTSDDISGSGDISNLAHYVISIHRYSKTEKEGEKDGKGNFKKGHEPIDQDCVLDIFKNRLTGHANKEVQLFFDYTSYRFFTKPEELWKRFGWNKNEDPLPTYNPNLTEKVPDAFGD